MNQVKVVSKFLFYITRFLAVCYLGITAYAAFCLASGWRLSFSADKKYFHVLYPFANAHFLNGDNNLPYILIDFIMPLGLYGVFFLLASNIFKVFFQPRLFSQYGIKQLRLFYIANLFVPPVAVLLAGIFTGVEDLAIILIILHFILGIFAYFFAAIFKQGVQLQNEQDLFI